MTPNCMMLRFKIFEKEEVRLDTTKGKNQVYLHPLIQAQSFFSKVAVYLDNVLVPETNLGEAHFLFQAINRTFCTSKLRNRKFGYPPDRIKTSKQHDITRKVTSTGTGANVVVTVDDLPENLKERYEQLNAVDKDSPDNFATLNFDCCFPLDSQSCQLRILEKKKIPTPFLHQGVLVQVRVHRRKDWHALLMKAVLHEETLIADTAITKENYPPDFTKFKGVELIDLQLGYETWTPVNTKPMLLHENHLLTYHSDFPDFQCAHMEHSVYTTHQRFRIPPMTRIAFLFLIPSHLFTYISTKNRHMAPFFTLPGKLENIRLLLDGEAVGPVDGFQYPGSKGYLNGACQAYYRTLTEMGLYEGALTDLFPPAGTIGNEQVFLINLTRRSTTHAPILDVDFTFGSTLAPKNWDICLITVKQVKHTCKYLKENIWHWNMNEDA